MTNSSGSRAASQGSNGGADISGEPVRVGISGLGRSGWGIHANVLPQVSDKFRVTAVCDPDPARQQEAIDRF